MHRPRPLPAIRLLLLAAVGITAALPQFRDPTLRPDYSARVTIVVQREDTGEIVPARIYLFRSGRLFRLSPVDSMIAFKQDNFYRNRPWRRSNNPDSLEIIVRDMSHVILTKGSATFDVPPWKEYRLEVHRGLFYEPAVIEFEVGPNEDKTIVAKVRPMAPRHQEQWISADQHVHIMRAREDDDLLLRWMQAEDLNVLNNLEGQRQQHFGVQYAWGRSGEARMPGQSIRSGHETRSDYFGHVLVLGGNRLIRPLGIGDMYGNTPYAYPHPYITFFEGRRAGGLVGYAHFHGAREHSQFIMNMALNTLDFVEVMQYALIKTPGWYELLNAGFRVTGTAGCDWPDPTDHFIPWERNLPLLGPERTLVKAEPGESAWETWADAVRRGSAVVSNGPLLDFTVNGRGIGSIIDWDGASATVRGEATAVFHRPLDSLEIVANGKVVASRKGDGVKTELSLPFELELTESTWIAARTESPRLREDIRIWAHASPVYVLKNRQPPYVKADRDSVLAKWETEIEFYKTAGFVFEYESQRDELMDLAERTRKILQAPQPPWPASR